MYLKVHTSKHFYLPIYIFAVIDSYDSKSYIFFTN